MKKRGYSRKHMPRAKAGRRRKRPGVRLLLMMAGLVAAGGLIGLSMAHPAGVERLRHWMEGTRYLWLTWRLAVYTLLAWGIRKVWCAPGCRPTDRILLLRLAIGGVMVLLVCEYALYASLAVAS